jgi:hypothetical protein
LYTNADTGRVQELAGERFDASDPEAGIDCLVRFLTAGLRAPSILAGKAQARSNTARDRKD